MTSAGTEQNAAEARARFWVIGHKGEPLPDLARVLGLAADGSTSIGEVKWAALPSPRDVWYIEEKEPASGDDYSSAVEGCLDRILTRLESVNAGDKLRAAGLTEMCEITLGGSAGDLRDVNIWHTPERLRRLAALGVALGEDFYQLAN